jgi:hypothetical protein
VSGNTINFRPVVFVEIESANVFQRCPRFLNGTIAALVYGDDGETVVGFELTLLDSGKTLTLTVDENTSVIDDGGVTTDPQVLIVGDTVFVRAELLPDGLLATLVVVGDAERIAGVVDQAVTDNRFVLDIDLDSDDGTIVEIIPGTTLILWGCGEEATPDAIQVGMRARIIGRLQGDGSVVAFVVLLSPRNVEGQLESVEPAEGGYQLSINVAPDDDTPDLLSVFLPAGAPINVKFDGPLSGDELMALVVCESRSVLVGIDRTVPTPVTAAKVTVIPETLLATVASVDTEQRQIVSEGGLWISIDDQARIFDLLNPMDLTADFSDISVGDQLLFYGLSLCEAEGAAFHAYVVSIITPDDLD